MKISKLLSGSFGLFLGLTNLALATTMTGPASFTYQGIVMNSAGTAPLTSVVSLKLSIYDPSATCLLYQEQQSNIDLSQTNGTFAVQVGSQAGAAKRTSSDQGLTMAQVFANGTGSILAVSTTGCTAGYTPAAGEVRLLRVAVTNGGSTVTISPDLQINSVPNAMTAETLQGLLPANLIQASGSVTQSALSSLISPTQSKAANGYVTLGGGIILEWGTTTFTSAANTDLAWSATLPFVLPHGALWAMASVDDPYIGGYGTQDATTGTTATTTTVSGGVKMGSVVVTTSGLHWIVIGN